MKRIESVDGDIFMIDRIRINGDYVIYLKTSNGEYYTIITSEFASHVIEAMLEEVLKAQALVELTRLSEELGLYE